MRTPWTAWLEHVTPGEGRTLLVWVGYASAESTARDAFADKFGQFFARLCAVEPGIIRNGVVVSLLSPHALNLLAAAAGKDDMECYAQLHVNAA